MRISLASLSVVLAMALTGCSTQAPDKSIAPPTRPNVSPDTKPVAPPPTVSSSFAPIVFNDIPNWTEQFSRTQWQSLASALAAQCMGSKTPAGKAAHWASLCLEWRGLESQLLSATNPGGELRQWIEARFSPWRWQRVEANGTLQLDGLLTGYYEAQIKVSRSPSAQFSVPIYKVPIDLLRLDIEAVYPEAKGQRLRGRLERASPINKIVPYYSRSEIDSTDVLKGQELLWTDDKIELFFTHIQGSARATLPDGQVLRIGYAEQNGHKYVAIGRTLVAMNALPSAAVTMQSINAWLRANPSKINEVLNSNPSYIFMSEVASPKNDSQLKRADGAVGSLGVALTPTRSVAVDPRQVPLGSLLFVKNEALQRLVVAQDTGGAIRGSLRADYYTGFGKEAADLAGVMKSPTQFWLLWPKGLVPEAVNP
jgi:membrane-bound lytic murein transglycosylase A